MKTSLYLLILYPRFSSLFFPKPPTVYKIEKSSWAECPMPSLWLNLSFCARDWQHRKRMFSFANTHFGLILFVLALGHPASEKNAAVNDLLVHNLLVTQTDITTSSARQVLEAFHPGYLQKNPSVLLKTSKASLEYNWKRPCARLQNPVCTRKLSSTPVLSHCNFPAFCGTTRTLVPCV